VESASVKTDQPGNCASQLFSENVNSSQIKGGTGIRLQTRVGSPLLPPPLENILLQKRRKYTLGN